MISLSPCRAKSLNTGPGCFRSVLKGLLSVHEKHITQQPAIPIFYDLKRITICKSSCFLSFSLFT